MPSNNFCFPQVTDKTLKFPFPGFTDFVKKNGENVAINFFQFKMDGDGKKLLKTVIPTFISFI